MIASEALSLERGPAKILTGNILEQRELLVAPVEGGEAGHTRPVLKIQDGCRQPVLLLRDSTGARAQPQPGPGPRRRGNLQTLRVAARARWC